MEQEDDVNYEIGDKVMITVSGEVGIVIGVAFYAYMDSQVLLRYKSADGRAVEQWWDMNAIEAVREH